MDHPAPHSAPQAAAAGPPPASIDLDLKTLRAALLRHARFTVGDVTVAEDLVQDTLIVVVENHASRRGEASLTTWAKGVLRHKIADWYRAPDRKRLTQLAGEDDRLDEDTDALYTSEGAHAKPVPRWQQPENNTERKQMMTVLDRCVSHLPERTGRVFLMREWLGFENAEICETLNISAENCRTILHRARTALRTCMQRDWIGKGTLA